VNGISQGKEKDFPIIWEVFWGDKYADLKQSEGCHIQLSNKKRKINHSPNYIRKSVFT
jgi:hypothetical protein